MRSLNIIAAAVAGLVAASTVQAAAISSGSVVVVRAGNGSAALGAGATAVFLDEYTLAGTLVQSIAANSTGGAALTLIGNSTTEGILTKSQDNNSLVFAGYRLDAGTTASVTAATKSIGVLNINGTLSTTVGVTDAGANATRGAASVDGSTFYLATAGAVRYVGTPGASATSAVVDARNSRQVTVANNTLYASNGSTAVTAKVQSYGTLPTGSATPTPIVTLLTTDAVNGFFVADLDATVAGIDTVYALVTTQSQLQKYSFDGTNWTLKGAIASTATDLAGVVTGSSVTLFTSSPTTLGVYSDTSGFANTITPGGFSTFATAGANTGFRGLAFVPEPMSIAGVAMGGLLLGRRRKA